MATTSCVGYDTTHRIRQQDEDMTHTSPPQTTGHSAPPLQHTFVMLPTLLQCRIQSAEPLRQVQVTLVCSEHMTLLGHYYDRVVDGQYFQKDILPEQTNTISWRIDMNPLAPAGAWLCTAILTACDDAEKVVRHELALALLWV